MIFNLREYPNAFYDAFGTKGDDIFLANGTESMRGGKGADTFIFNETAMIGGDSTVIDLHSNDTLVFQEPADIHIGKHRVFIDLDFDGHTDTVIAVHHMFGKPHIAFDL